MTKEVVEAWNPQDGEALLAALTEALELAKSEGHRADTVYPNKCRMTLVRETLTDGSHVMNLHFFDGVQ